jgi:REG-2-like HAD superfamily hydrolase
MVKAVFLDVGHTLIYPFPSLEEVALEVLREEGFELPLSKLQATLKQVDEYYEKIFGENTKLWASQGEVVGLWEELYGYWMELVGLDSRARHLGRRLYEVFGDARKWRPFDEVLPALRRFKQEGLCLGVVSNWDDRLESILEKLGFGDKLDFVLASAKEGLSKPDQRFFKLALDLAGVEPAQALHVGDHPWADFEGAHQVGIKPVLIDRFHRYPDFTSSRIERLDQLFEFL